MKRALITGITGQDGSYLAELLLSKNYEVHGLVRRSSTFNRQRIDHLHLVPENDDKLILHYGDIGSTGSLLEIIYEVRPDEIYHLAAQSHVRVSFDIPDYTSDVTGLGTIRILDAIRKSGCRAKFYQASSSEMFGAAKPPQNEFTPFYPRSPYAIAKVFAFHATRNYREAYGMYASNGILFNHESPRRGENFVTRKITRSVARILAGQQKELFLGNLDARRDWGYAPEYVQVMWQMLQEDEPGDFVIGTGKSISVEQFLSLAFEYVGLDWRDYVKSESRLERPTEVDHLQADPSRAKEALNWKARVSVEDLVRIMVDADLRLLSQPCPGKGEEIRSSLFGDWQSPEFP